MTISEYPWHSRLGSADWKPASVFVHKFGGTSVGSASAICAVRELLRGFAGRQIAVVSALSGVTNLLVEGTRCPGNGAEVVDKLRKRHVDVIDELGDNLGKEFRAKFMEKFEQDLAKIAHCLEALHLTNGTVPEVFQDLVWGYGELWSAEIVAAVCGQSVPWVDARSFLFLKEAGIGRAAAGSVNAVDWQRSATAWRELDEHSQAPLVIVTGFVCSTHGGAPATLKRNGSDHSAAILANLADAALLTVWKEIDGAFSADPRQVKEAVQLEQLSYHEASELAYFGANVLHPATMQPCITKNIPIVIRNTFNKKAEGTLITRASCAVWKKPCKAFTTIPCTALVNIEGTAMVGVRGTAVRVFQAVSDAGVNIVMITQASSEHSITFAVLKSEVERCKKALDLAFFYELNEGNVAVTVDDNTAILTAVGDDMAHQTGLLGRLALALGKAGVSIRAIAQGASERNITFVVAADSCKAGLNAVHQEIYGSP